MTKKKTPFLKKFRAVHRLLLSIGLALIVFAILVVAKLELVLAVILGWNSFTLFMVIISWITFFSTSSRQLAISANVQDESRYVIFIIVIISVAIMLFGTFALIQNTEDGLMGRGLHIATTLTSVFLSWCLLHTMYTLRYAHLYYSESMDNPTSHPCGLAFPKNTNPDYLDFAYFPFVIGMTFQVSDVQITSSEIRRFALLHGLISFVFNTIIVALTINIIAGLIK